MSHSKRKIKVEVDEDDKGSVSNSSSKKSKRGGDEDGPVPVALVLNRRGMPARIRKKNRLYINDDVVTPSTHQRTSPKKASSTPKTPTSSSAPSTSSTPKERKAKPDLVSDSCVAPDKKIAQRIGVRLRNLLKLPKAHKWVCYEWFYSNLDKALFEGDNDFMTCLRESFPNLKSRNMTRVEWCKIRRMMGKPRRCSQSFFEEERRELERKRTKIRALQQRKASADLTMFKDLPDEIPLQLVIGTKVTARIRKPQDGLFTGSIDAVDTSNNTYRITFERQGLGTHSIPDYEVLSNESPETISMSSLAARMRPRSLSAVTPVMGAATTAEVSTERIKSEVPTPVVKTRADAAGGFPVKLLEVLVRLNKVLKLKQNRVNSLREMNVEGERRCSLGMPMQPDFVRRYASTVIELDRINVALSDFLFSMQESCNDGVSSDETSSANAVAPSTLRELSEEEARVLVVRHNESKGEPLVNSERLLRLVTYLTSVMLQLKGLSSAEGDNAFELKVLQETVDKIRNSIHPSNLPAFHNSVESHLQHIQLGMGQRGMLAPFLSQRA